MNREMELKLQAYLDGELSRREARRVAEWVEQDPQAKALCTELETTRNFVKANEPEITLPESREFYWSKIERRISEAGKPEHRSPWELLLAWRRYLAPVTATALALFLLMHYNLGNSWQQLAEVENLTEETGSFSFRSHSDNMFVVWVYDKDQTQILDIEPEPIEEDDPVVQ